jgi:hypothetical protein
MMLVSPPFLVVFALFTPAYLGRQGAPGQNEDETTDAEAMRSGVDGRTLK